MGKGKPEYAAKTLLEFSPEGGGELGAPFTKVRVVSSHTKIKRVHAHVLIIL